MSVTRTEEPRSITPDERAKVDLEGLWDVVVVGGGNAALVAALSANRPTNRVLLLERAPIEMRGGNTRHTRNVRCVHLESDAYNSGAYLADELWSDLCAVGAGPSNEKLAALTVEKSEQIPRWMTAHGIHWQTPLTGTLHLGRTNRFFLGGGKALINTYYRTASRSGVVVAYDANVEQFEMVGNRANALIVDVAGVRSRITAKSIVCACGGFEANIPWLSRYWGDAANNYAIRGSAFNDGSVLAALFELGAGTAGEEKGFHAVAVDARSPKYDGGIATRLDCIPFAIVLNKHGKRFYDEGEELWPKRYAMWGRKIAEQDDQIAYALWDSKVSPFFLPPMYGPAKGATLPEVIGALGLDEAVVSSEIERFNRSIVPGGSFDPNVLDGCRTDGIDPPKTHWAQRLDRPPYYGIAMRPGITFTYMGLAVDDGARVLFEDGTAFSNVFAAGEIMSGNVLSTGYLAGFGLTIGSVWGRIAGSNAAEHAEDDTLR